MVCPGAGTPSLSRPTSRGIQRPEVGAASDFFTLLTCVGEASLPQTEDRAALVTQEKTPQVACIVTVIRSS
jgi:hypothetical protein